MTMTTQRYIVALAIVTVAGGTSAAAQELSSVAPPDGRPSVATPAGLMRPGARIPLDVRVVISKFQGDKLVSTVPYLLAINAVTSGDLNRIEKTQLTIGSEVPVPATTFVSSSDGKPASPLRSFNYRNVGTTIAAAAIPADADRFELDVSIDESSLGTSQPDGQGQASAAMPVFKSFKTRNRLLLRSGQTRQFTAATDRVNGETVRIDVTLTTVK